jgi:hypothetical protein
MLLTLAAAANLFNLAGQTGAVLAPVIIYMKNILILTCLCSCFVSKTAHAQDQSQYTFSFEEIITRPHISASVFTFPPESFKVLTQKDINTHKPINDLDSIHKYEIEKNSIQKSMSGTIKTQGVITTTVYGKTVSALLITKAYKINSGNWIDGLVFKKITEPKTKLSHLFELDTKHYTKFKDYSNGVWVNSIGKTKTGSHNFVGTVQNTDGYSFPYTLGENKVLVIPFANFKWNDIFVSKVTKRTMPGNVVVTETIETDENNNFRNYTMAYNNKPLMTLAVKTKRINNTFVVSEILKTDYDARLNTINRQIKYTLLGAHFGQNVDVKDLISFGPRGINVRDERLNSKVPADYTLTDRLKTMDELNVMHQALVKTSAATSEPKNISLAQKMKIGFATSGVLLLLLSLSLIAYFKKQS